MPYRALHSPASHRRPLQFAISSNSATSLRVSLSRADLFVAPTAAIPTLFDCPLAVPLARYAAPALSLLCETILFILWPLPACPNCASIAPLVHAWTRRSSLLISELSVCARCLICLDPASRSIEKFSHSGSGSVASHICLGPAHRSTLKNYSIPVLRFRSSSRPDSPDLHSVLRPLPQSSASATDPLRQHFRRQSDTGSRSLT